MFQNKKNEEVLQKCKHDQRFFNIQQKQEKYLFFKPSVLSKQYAFAVTCNTALSDSRNMMYRENNTDGKDLIKQYSNPEMKPAVKKANSPFWLQ